MVKWYVEKERTQKFRETKSNNNNNIQSMSIGNKRYLDHRENVLLRCFDCNVCLTFYVPAFRFDYYCWFLYFIILYIRFGVCVSFFFLWIFSSHFIICFFFLFFIYYASIWLFYIFIFSLLAVVLLINCNIM